MKFCSRCQGGELTSHCPVCGGAGFISAITDDDQVKTSERLKEEKLKEAEREKIRRVTGYRTPIEGTNALVKKKKKKPSKNMRPVTKPAGAGKPQKKQDVTSPVAPVTPKKLGANISRRHPKRASHNGKEAEGLAQQLDAVKDKIVLAPSLKNNGNANAKKTDSKKIRKNVGTGSKKRKSLPVSESKQEPVIHRKKPSKPKVFAEVTNGKMGPTRYVDWQSVHERRADQGLSSPLPNAKGTKPGGSSRGFFFGDDDDSESESKYGTFEARYREEDAGRYMGHSFREQDGRFGSLPIYDDHDED